MNFGLAALLILIYFILQTVFIVIKFIVLYKAVKWGMKEGGKYIERAMSSVQTNGSKAGNENAPK